VTDKRNEPGEFDVLNLVNEELQSIESEIRRGVGDAGRWAYRIRVAMGIVEARLGSRFEFSTDGIDPAELESDFQEMSEAEIESFWKE